MTNATHAKLFTPLQVGPIALQHRVVMAPLTRSRSEQPGDVPNDLMIEYYTQRASDGGLIISEGTSISITGRGWFGAPGIYSAAQIAAWRRVTDAVHAKAGRIFLQLWHVGRSSHVNMTGGKVPVGPSVVPDYWSDSHTISTPEGWINPSPHRALEIAEIAGIVEEYREAARRAKAAGFDGVEVHSGNGYLPDQFLQDGSNKRTDAYGGPVANRSRFLLEVVEAVSSEWGGDRTGVRIGPGGTWNGMSDSNPDELFNYVAGELNRFGLAYLHIIEPRIKGNVTIAAEKAPVAAQQLRRIFKGNILAAGGFEPQSAEAIVEQGDADMVAFGRLFIANPDLPKRISHGLPLNDYDRNTFYSSDFHGYIDYPFYGEQETCDMQAGQQWYVGCDKQRVAKWNEPLSVEETNKALVLEAFDTLYNKRDYAAAERYWSPNYTEHSAAIAPGRDGLFSLVKRVPSTLKYEPGMCMAQCELVMLQGRFSGFGQPVNRIAADIVRVKDGVIVEHWAVIQDEAGARPSKSGLPLFDARLAA